MSRLAVAASVALLTLGGCGSSSPVTNGEPRAGASSTPGAASVETDTATPTPAAKPTQTAKPKPDLNSRVLAPGKAGPFTVGMSADQALRDGLVREPTENECGMMPVGRLKGISLQFADSDAGDVLFGVLVKDSHFRTAQDIGVGDSIDLLQQTYGNRIKETTGEYGETKWVLSQGTQAIGFTEEQAAAGGRISAIDVFRAGNPPIWDGC